MMQSAKLIHQSGQVYHMVRRKVLDNVRTHGVSHPQRTLIAGRSSKLQNVPGSLRACTYPTSRSHYKMSSPLSESVKGHRLQLQNGAICKRYLHSSSSNVSEQQVKKTEVNESLDQSIYPITDDGKTLVVELNTGNVDRFNATWLRHNCQCGHCTEPHSGQKRLEPVQLHPTYTLRDVQPHPQQEGRLLLHWYEEDHIGEASISHLEQHSYSMKNRNQQCLDRMPSVCKGTIPVLQYQDVIDSEEGLWTWLSSMNDVGLTLIKGVPTEDGMVKQVAEKVWTVMPTIYGKTFDVVSTPQPINIAYSTESLGFHMDLVYYESPPGIQLLHCKKFDWCVRGGESVMVDAWYEAENLRQNYPEDFDILTRVPATFQKHHFNREHPVHMTYQRPHIVVGQYTGQITNVNWAPAFEGPLCVNEEDIEPYYRAYHRYAQMLENSETKMELILQVGDLLAFNNRRILHSRKAFTLNGGSRHLEGCYLNIDEFKSKVEVLSKKYNNGKPAKYVFNQSVL